MHHLDGKRVLMLLGPRYEDSEAAEPLEFLRGRGAEVDVVGVEKGKLAGLRGRASIAVGRTVREVDASDYDAMVIPGGRSPAALRKYPEVVELVREFGVTGRPIAAICHGPQLLIAADLVSGKTLTGYHKIAGEMTRAGVDYVDVPLAVAGSIITSRRPSDIPQFNAAIEKALLGD